MGGGVALARPAQMLFLAVEGGDRMLLLLGKKQQQGSDRRPVPGTGEAAPQVLCAVLGPSQ